MDGQTQNVINQCKFWLPKAMSFGVVNIPSSHSEIVGKASRTLALASAVFENSVAFFNLGVCHWWTWLNLVLQAPKKRLLNSDFVYFLWSLTMCSFFFPGLRPFWLQGSFTAPRSTKKKHFPTFRHPHFWNMLKEYERDENWSKTGWPPFIPKEWFLLEAR